MIPILAQQELLADPLRAIRDQFREGGSLGGLIIALLVLGALLAIAYAAAERQRRKRAGMSRRMTSQRLFDLLMVELKLDKEEQACLSSACQAAGIVQPAAVLLAEGLFDQAARSAGQEASVTPQQIESLRRKIFARSDRLGVVTRLAPEAQAADGAKP
jgi:hypothetical protein